MHECKSLQSIASILDLAKDIKRIQKVIRLYASILVQRYDEAQALTGFKESVHTTQPTA